MRFLADENFEGPIVRALEAVGHDVEWIREAQPGARDAEVLARAEHDQRILLTNDKDFAELAYLQRQATSGIVLLRLPAMRSLRKTQRLLAALDRIGEGLAGFFTVLTPRAIRRRPLPARHDRD
jgi:predicted nuclease of predicted toxin-antitoxin system